MVIIEDNIMNLHASVKATYDLYLNEIIICCTWWFGYSTIIVINCNEIRIVWKNSMFHIKPLTKLVRYVYD